MSTHQEQSRADQQSLSGQQVQALQKQYAEAITAIKNDMALRKLALDQAVAVCGNPSAQVPDIVKLAKAMHAFLLEGAR